VESCEPVHPEGTVFTSGWVEELVAIHATSTSPAVIAAGAVSVIEVTAVEVSAGVAEEMKVMAAAAGDAANVAANVAAEARMMGSSGPKQHRRFKGRIICRW
jgi:hypothetical protein